MRTSAAREEEVERGGRGETQRDAPLEPLSALCVPRTGVRDPSSNPDEPFKYVDISAVDNRAKRITAPQTLMGKAAPSRARNVIRAGDVLVATTRPNLNAVAMVPGELDDQICSTGFCVLRAGPRIHPDYLFQFVQSPAFVQPLSDLVKGALYPAVNDSQVLALEIPLPPLTEQERIAGRLTEQLGAVERARAAAAQRLAAAESLPAALLREVFDGPQASGWETVRLGDLVNSHDDRREPVRSSDRKPGPYPYYGASGIIDYVDRFIFDGEYLLIAEDGANLLARATPIAFVARGQFWVNNHAHVVQPKDPEHLDFLVSYFAWLDIADFVTGSAQPKLNQAVLHDLQVRLPPKAELPRLAAELTQRLAAAEGVIARCREELAAIEALPASLLRDAFGGPRGPSEQPAPVNGGMS